MFDKWRKSCFLALLPQYIYLMKKAFTALFIAITAWAAAQGPTWRTFDSSNVALPTNICISAAVGPDNMKWIGTYSGLVSTDGSVWTTYNTANSGLPDNIVRGVTVDVNNVVWVATLNGIANYNGEEWTVYLTDTNNIIPILFLCVAVDNLGNIYAGTEEDGLFWYNGIDWQQFTTANSAIQSNRIESIAVKGQDDLWLGTNSKGVIHASPGTGNFTQLYTQNSNMPFDFVKTVTLCTDGYIWAGTGSALPDSGLVRIQPQTESIEVYDIASTGIAFEKVWAISFDGDDLYVGTNDTVFGIATLDTSGWATIDFNSSGLVSNYVYSIVIDDSSYKWIATFNGISVYNAGGVLVSTQQQTVLPINVKLYPQPATDRVFFAVNLAQPQNLKVEIFSLEGNLMDSFSKNVFTNDVIDYNTSALAQGMYLARVSSNNVYTTLKLIITK